MSSRCPKDDVQRSRRRCPDVQQKMMSRCPAEEDVPKMMSRGPGDVQKKKVQEKMSIPENQR